MILNEALGNCSTRLDMYNNVYLNCFQARGRQGIETDGYLSTAGSLEREIREEYEEIREKLSDTTHRPTFCQGT